MVYYIFSLFFICLFLLYVFFMVNYLGPTRPGPHWYMMYFGIANIIFAPLIIVLFPVFLDVWQMQGVTKEGAVSAGLIFYVQLGLFLIGAILSCIIFPLRKYNFSSGEGSFPVKEARASFFMLFVLTFIVISKAGVIPIYHYLTEHSVPEHRIIAASSLGGIYGVLLSLKTFLAWAVLYFSAEAKIRKRPYKLYLAASVFALSWMGAKEPLVMSLVGFYFYVSLRSGVGILKILSLGALSLGVVALVYYMIGMEYSVIFFELINRAFLGYMHAYFQELEFYHLENKDYWKSWLPLSSVFFAEAPHYARDVMIFTEGLKETTGVKNAFFGAELSHVLGTKVSYLISFVTGFLLFSALYVFSCLINLLFSSSVAVVFLWAVLSRMTLSGGFFIFPSLRFLYVPLVAILLVLLVIVFTDKQRLRFLFKPF